MRRGHTRTSPLGQLADVDYCRGITKMDPYWVSDCSESGVLIDIRPVSPATMTIAGAAGAAGQSGSARDRIHGRLDRDVRRRQCGRGLATCHYRLGEVAFGRTLFAFLTTAAIVLPRAGGRLADATIPRASAARAVAVRLAVASGLYILWRETFRRRRPAAAGVVPFSGLRRVLRKEVNRQLSAVSGHCSTAKAD